MCGFQTADSESIGSVTDCCLSHFERKFLHDAKFVLYFMFDFYSFVDLSLREQQFLFVLFVIYNGLFRRIFINMFFYTCSYAMYQYHNDA